MGILTAAGFGSEVFSASISMASSSAKESRLPERLGISEVTEGADRLARLEMEGAVALAWGSQQKVSRFHNLQLRFSNRRPCSNDSEHLENTGFSLVSGVGCHALRARHSPVHMLKRFSTLLVSTLWMSPTSTVRTGASNLAGMVI